MFLKNTMFLLRASLKWGFKSLLDECLQPMILLAWSNAISKIQYDSQWGRESGCWGRAWNLWIITYVCCIKFNFTCLVLIKSIIQSYFLTRQISSFSVPYILSQEDIYTTKWNSIFKACLWRQNIAICIYLYKSHLDQFLGGL